MRTNDIHQLGAPLEAGNIIGNNTTSQVNNTTVYINMQTGKIVDNVNTSEIGTTVQALAPNTPVYLNLDKAFGYQESALSLNQTSGSLTLTAQQYQNYISKLKDLNMKYDATDPSGVARQELVMEAQKAIVDNKINFPSKTSVYDKSRLQMYALIQAVGPELVKNLQNPSSQSAGMTFGNVRGAQQTQAEALMAQFNSGSAIVSGSSTQNTSLTQANNTIPNQSQGFFDSPVTKEIVKFGYRLRTGEMTKDGEVGKGVMLVGDGANLRSMRTKVLVNKMIDALNVSDANAVVKNVLCFRKMSFGRCGGFLHDKKIINSMKDPAKFAAKFKRKLDTYIDYRLRNLPEDKKEAMKRAIVKAYNTFVQNHINQARATMISSSNQTRPIATTAINNFNPN